MSDTSIIREVEEELRRERMTKLAKSYGPLAAGIALLIVLGVAGYKGWEHYERTTAAATGARFDEALQLAADGKKEDADKVLAELAGSGPSGYRTLARLNQASAQAEAGAVDGAVASYDAVAADGSADPALRSYARIAAATLLVDKVDSTALENRLKDLDSDGQPWRHAARELIALSAFRAGELDKAGRYFTALLADQAAPQGIRRRAELMMALIVADQAKAG